MPTTDAIKWRLKIRFMLEYAVARTMTALVDLVPLRAAVWFAARGGDLAWLLAIGRRRIARENILRSGIAPDAAAADRIARASFRNFAIMLVETMKSAMILRDDRWRSSVRFALTPELMQAITAPQPGVIMAAGHYGNFELGGQVASINKPVAGVMRSLSNPYIDRMVKRRFPRVQFHFVPKNDADYSRFVRLLDDGEILAMMIDQHGGQRGMLVDFLGRPASTHTGIALLSLITNKPLVFGYCRRTGLMQFEFGGSGPHFPVHTGDRQRDVRAILEWLNGELGKVIRADPTQYMWGHRRWRPEDEKRAAE